ncbi:MAG: hypothetical protein ABEH38_00270 [Flavobacteriales bacterium]
MILNAYRSDHPGSLLTLPLIVALLWTAAIFEGSPPPPYDGMPLYEILGGFFRAYPWIGWLTGALLALIGSLFCIGIARDLEFPEDHGNLPPLLYPLLVGLFPSAQWAHPTAFANLFLMLAFWRLMKVQKGGDPTSHLFDAGFSLGVAAMFHLPFLLFFPFLWIAAFILRAIGWRDLLWPLIGLMIPFLFLSVYYYWIGSLGALPRLFWFKGVEKLLFTENRYLLSLSLWGMLGIFTLSGLILSFRELQNSNMQGKKLRWIFFLFIPFTFACAVLGAEHFADPFAWGVLAFPLSYLLTRCFNRKGWNSIYSIAFYLWLFLLIANDHLSSYF